MIVVDAGLIVAFFSKHGLTADAEAAMEKDPEWIAPGLWKAEVRNVFAKRHRLEKAMTAKQARDAYADALLLLGNQTGDIDHSEAMGLTLRFGISGYDAEYLALAEEKELLLVSTDERLVNHLQSHRVQTAVHLKEFIGGK